MLIKLNFGVVRIFLKKNKNSELLVGRPFMRNNNNNNNVVAMQENFK
jgi:hypothetical protein